MINKLRVILIDLSENVDFVLNLKYLLLAQGCVYKFEPNPEQFLKNITLTPQRYDLAVVVSTNNGFNVNLNLLMEEMETIEVLEVIVESFEVGIIDKKIRAIKG